MTTALIMQPPYLGWLGFWDMADQADVVIIDDLAAVAPQTWQTRNRIRGRDGNTVWLSIPVHAKWGQPLKEVRVANEHRWQEKHRRAIHAAYSHAPLFEDWMPTHRQHLTQTTEHALRLIAYRLGVNTRMMRASQLARLRHGRTQRLADMLQSVGATEMLETAGGRDVFPEGNIEGIPIRFHNYQHPAYDQGGPPFVSHLAVIDLLSWNGPASLDIIRSGRV